MEQKVPSSVTGLISDAANFVPNKSILSVLLPLLMYLAEKTPRGACVPISTLPLHHFTTLLLDCLMQCQYEHCLDWEHSLGTIRTVKRCSNVLLEVWRFITGPQVVLTLCFFLGAYAPQDMGKTALPHVCDHSEGAIPTRPRGDMGKAPICIRSPSLVELKTDQKHVRLSWL